MNVWATETPQRKSSWHLTLTSPKVLAPFGERGVFFGDVGPALPTATFRRPRARATGRAGDVYVCHPFVVHRATWSHLGSGPRMLAQPSVANQQPFALRDDTHVCPVERATLRGLASGIRSKR